MLRYVAHACFFLVSFVACLYLTFPWSAAKDRILHLASERAGMEITARELSPSWLTGVEAKGLRIARPGVPDPIEIAEVALRAHLFALLTGDVGVTVKMPVAQGRLDADIVIGEDDTAIIGKAEAIELALVPGLAEAIGIPIGGKLDLEADLTIGTKDPKVSEGTLAVRGKGLEILKGGKISGFPVPELTVGDLDWKITVNKGKVEIPKQEIKGDNVEILLDGDITLIAPLERSNLNLVLGFRPTPAYLAKEPLLNALLANIRGAKGDDGYYSYALTGSMKHPRFFQRRR